MSKKSAKKEDLDKDLEKMTINTEDTENMPMSEEQINAMKERLFAEQPEMKQFFDHLQEMSKRSIEQAQNPSITIQNKRGKVTPELLEKYPNSPTAKTTMEAYNHYEFGCRILWSYQRPRVLTQVDCDFLQPGFHNYMEGYMVAGYMSSQFPFPPNVEQLVEDYLKLRPTDLLVEYFGVTIINHMKSKQMSDYEGFKLVIRALEEFAHKILPYKSETLAKKMLAHAYYLLGAQYTITDQYARALDVFEKLYELDKSNIESKYNIAFHLMDKDPERAIKLLHECIDKFPKCAKKYPNAFYVLGFIHVSHYKNYEEGLKYYHLGLKAETYKLPFNPPTDFGPKSFLQSLVPLHQAKKAKQTRKEIQNTLDELD